ncbi:MAG: hypothetical protein GKS02_04580 [Alphaproteobacteria bacterium]|nr:hypothetical protein [Alphaproteobacteria bacterium]
MTDIEKIRTRLKQEIPLFGATPAEVSALHDRLAASPNGPPPDLNSLQTYCFFMGYPRSGHSLVGALLDAHPDMVIAHELDAIMFMEANFDRGQIEKLLIENARLSGKAGRIWGPYSYQVEGQWQGRHRNIRVLGDKKGGMTSLRIGQDRSKLPALLRLFENRVKFVHVIRNPFDTIATLTRKSSMDLAGAAKRFLHLAETNAFIRQELGPASVLDVWHEEFAADPSAGLSQICKFLDVEADPAYLTACADIVVFKARQSRDTLDWPQRLVSQIEAGTRRFDFLNRYAPDG